MKRLFGITLILSAAVLCAGMAAAADSTVPEQEVPTLREYNFLDIVKHEKCVVMFYNPESSDNVAVTKKRYEVTPLQLGDKLMRGLMAMREKTGSSVKLYRVNWKDFTASSIERIRFDLESVYKQPESPSFAAFTRDGKMIFKARGISRPDVLAWLVNEMMDDYMPSIPSDKGEYLRAGWMTTDTTGKFVNLVNLRNEERSFNGKLERVRINSFKSDDFGDYSCTYEQIYLTNGRLIGSIESCGPYGTVGYYDYDGTGKMQYRVKYHGNPWDRIRPASPQ